MFRRCIKSNIQLINNRNANIQRCLLRESETNVKQLCKTPPYQRASLRFIQRNGNRLSPPSIYRNVHYSNVHLASLLTSKRLLHLPQFPKKIPNKYELLIQARGFLQRLKVRIKYPLMKQMRPFTLNDITALFSWVFLGHTVWLLVGTTSFISLGLWAANSLQFEGN